MLSQSVQSFRNALRTNKQTELLFYIDRWIIVGSNKIILFKADSVNYFNVLYIKILPRDATNSKPTKLTIHLIRNKTKKM